MLPGTLITFKSQASQAQGEQVFVTCIVIRTHEDLGVGGKLQWVDVLHSDSACSPSIIAPYGLVSTIKILQKEEGWVVIPPQGDKQ